MMCCPDFKPGTTRSTTTKPVDAATEVRRRNHSGSVGI